MQQRAYGNTGLTVSALCYGAMTIAADPDLRDGVAPSLLRALEGGVTIIDTARVYPDSEEIIAATLKAWTGPRPLVSTKLAPSCRETFREFRPIGQAYTPQSIVASVEASLKALETERLDIVHLHQWWHMWTYADDVFAALEKLRCDGKIGHVAISTGDHEHDQALEAVSRRLVSGVQLILNLFESRPLASILPLAGMRGTGIIARCVFDSGGLSGALTEEEFKSRNFLKHAPYAEYRQRLAAFERQFIPEPAADIKELALRFALSAPSVSTVTVGMPTVDMVDQCLAIVAKGALSDQDMEAICREHVWTKNFYEKLI